MLDTSYAYVVPLVLSIHTFSLQADKSLFTTFLFSLTLPIFFIGFRNILLHQIHDVIGDYHAKRRTLPMILGKNELFNLLSISLFIEVISFCILYEWFFPEIHLGIIYLVYFSLKFFIFSKKETIKSSKNEFDFFRLTDRFYQIWFPVFVLFILTMKSTDWQFLWFFQLFILLLNFKSHVINGKILSVLNSLKIGLSYFVNYSIFFAFLIFGVNLKKEQMSAWQYLTRKSN